MTTYCRYVKYNPTNDMLITGIRRENQISSFGINDEPDENHETRLISCSSFFDHLLRSLSSIIDNIDPNSFVNLGHYWSHIQIHTGSYYNVLKSCDKVQLQPVKFVSANYFSITHKFHMYLMHHQGPLLLYFSTCEK